MKRMLIISGASSYCALNVEHYYWGSAPIHAPVVQRIERETSNFDVAGSIPAGGAMDHYQHYYGYRQKSNFGAGDILAPWAEGEIVDIPEGALAFQDKRIPHSWSERPELSKPGRYRVVTSFSIGEGNDWYFRVVPVVGGKTIWGESSDRLHVIEGKIDYTEDWTLIKSADQILGP
jgi:hypothetical protein